jgi:hypothetical protein
MKKIVLLLIGLSFLACKKEKDEFTILKDSIEPLDLPQNIVGKWRSGIWGGQTIDSTNQQILIVNADKTYQSCKNQNCQTSEWVYGFRMLTDGVNPFRDTLLVFKPIGVSGVRFARHIDVLKDTLHLGSFCYDCISPTYLRVK